MGRAARASGTWAGVLLWAGAAACSAEDPAHLLTVVDGAGSGAHRAGAVVPVAAAAAPLGRRFARWIGSVAHLVDPTAPVTTLIMPGRPVAIAPLFEPAEAGGLPAAQRGLPCDVALRGPASRALASDRNPFRVDVEVVFSGPGHASYPVPAFFDGDGAGGRDGDRWTARFAPPREGLWGWVSRSTEPTLHGRTGVLRVGPPPEDAPEFARRGPLRPAGRHHPAFADGTPWLKGGADNPEDFLGNAHLGTEAARLRAIDLLAEYGINGLYVMTMNVDGDGNNVWPWIGASPREAKDNADRFDTVRLAEWERIFAHMQRRGLVIHLVLEDDSGWTGFDRHLYYREMVARFAHHNGLIWNLSEEFNENYDEDEIREHAALLRALDPYGHPIALHHAGTPDVLEPFLDGRAVDVLSIQTADRPQYGTATRWFRKDRRVALAFDETGKIDARERGLARRIAWSVYLGGAAFELHAFPVYEGRTEFEDFAGHFRDLARARRFVEEHVDTRSAAPAPELLAEGATAWVLADPGRAWIVYVDGPRPVTLDLSGVPGTLRARWFDPSTGAWADIGGVDGGASQSFGPGPFPDDAVLLLERTP